MPGDVNDHQPPGNPLDAQLRAARAGSPLALGQLLDAYRPFLLAIAAEHLDSLLKPKANPSDVVQETFVDAQRDFASFQSETEEELRLWLHRILLNNLADLRKRYLRAKKRQVRLERPISGGESKQLLRQLMDRHSLLPEQIISQKEQIARLEQALY